MTFIQNRIASVVVVAVSVFVAVNATAKPNAAARTRSAAGWNVARPGRRITSTPTNPSTSTPIRLGVRRSPSSSTAMLRISKILSAAASARIDSAMVQNASIARVIHRTTRTMLDGEAAIALP